MSLFVITKSIHQVTSDSQKNVKLEMFFKEDLNEENKSWVESLKNKFEIQEIHLVSKSEAQNIFVELMKKDWGSLAEDKDLLVQLPSSVVIQYQDDLQPQRIENVTDQIVNEAQQFENYDSYIFQKDWAQWFASYKNFSRQILLYAIVFFGLLIFFIVSNLNRSLIVQHTKEIEVLHLIGATRWQITKPFLLKSGALGILSSLISYVAIQLIVDFFKTKSFESGQLFPVDKIVSIGAFELAIFLLMTLAICLYSAQNCVRDQLR